MDSMICKLGLNALKNGEKMRGRKVGLGQVLIGKVCQFKTSLEVITLYPH